MRTLVYTPTARSDLEHLCRCLAANPIRAIWYTGDIQRACLRLCDKPALGRPRPDLRPNLRLLVLWQLIIAAYQPSGTQIHVLRLFWKEEDYEAIMTGG